MASLSRHISVPRREAEAAVGSGFINAPSSSPRLDCTFGFLVLAIALQIDDNHCLVLLSLISPSSAQSAISGAQFRGALSGGILFLGSKSGVGCGKRYQKSVVLVSTRVYGFGFCKYITLRIDQT
jgi:hypothetical protein